MDRFIEPILTNNKFFNKDSTVEQVIELCELIGFDNLILKLLASSLELDKLLTYAAACFKLADVWEPTQYVANIPEERKDDVIKMIARATERIKRKCNFISFSDGLEYHLTYNTFGPRIGLPLGDVFTSLALAMHMHELSAFYAGVIIMMLAYYSFEELPEFTKDTGDVMDPKWKLISDSLKGWQLIKTGKQGDTVTARTVKDFKFLMKLYAHFDFQAFIDLVNEDGHGSPLDTLELFKIHNVLVVCGESRFLSPRRQFTKTEKVKLPVRCIETVDDMKFAYEETTWDKCKMRFRNQTPTYLVLSSNKQVEFKFGVYGCIVGYYSKKDKEIAKEMETRKEVRRNLFKKVDDVTYGKIISALVQSGSATRDLYDPRTVIVFSGNLERMNGQW